MNQGFLVGQLFPELNGPGTPDVYIVMASFRNMDDATGYMNIKNAVLEAGEPTFTIVQVLF
jgi:hypothetical protein